MKSLLIVDDEKSICNVLKFALEDRYKVFVANNLMEFNSIVDYNQIDIALVDLKFGHVNGLDLIKKINMLNKHAIIIMITAYGTIETAIQAIKLGAYDYILKPIELDMLRELLVESNRYYALKKNLILENSYSKNDTDIIGKSAKIINVMEMINKVKNLDVTVLIQGETGTGKGLVAREIHYKGSRKKGPFVVVNCGAIPQNLIESELFGYEKGAFTGAEKPRKGAFELANGGSLFLDEIGETDISSQVKLLKAIEEKEITPIGSGKSIKIDVRIIAATNKDLEQAANKGKFRSDLFYRLNVLPIYLPSLRERSEDIPLLVSYFINKANELYNLNINGIEEGALNYLKNMDYKGNVRELENLIYRLCILNDEDIIRYDNFNIKENKYNNYEIKDKNYISFKIGTKIEETEKMMILKTLDFVGGDKAKAAQMLGISERSIYYKINDYLNKK